MACVKYNTPLIVDKDAEQTRVFIQTFIDNMILAGMIRITPPSGHKVSDSFNSNIEYRDFDGDTFNNLYNSVLNDGTNWASGASKYVTSITFKVPTGNGQNVYEDDPDNAGYEKIKRSSYDSTEYILRFDIRLRNTYTSATSVSNPRILYIYPYIMNDFNSTISPIGTYSFFGSLSNTTYSQRYKGVSFISLTTNNLTIAVGQHVTVTGGGVTDYNKYLMLFSVYRKNDYMYLYGVSGGNVYNATSPPAFNNQISSDIRMIVYDSKYNTSDEYLQRDTSFMYMPSASDTSTNGVGFTSFGQVYAKNNNSDVFQIPELGVTKILLENPSEVSSVYKMDNRLVTGKYINLGRSDRSQLPLVHSKDLYSWAFLYDESIEFTTEDL